MLGLLPGWGGTQNLPALIGYKEAVPMVLMGKEVRPDKAKKIGLVDVVVDPFALESVAVRSILLHTCAMLHISSFRLAVVMILLCYHISAFVASLLDYE
jgi:enoyl-CoA hydratase/carnithine racemase